MSNRRFLAVVTVALIAAGAQRLSAQSLSLSSATASSSGAATLNLTFTSAGASIAALQWTFQYPAAGVSAIAATAGPALTAAGKSISCASANGAYNCVAYGMNATAIADGVIATVSVTASQTATIAAANTLGASPTGASVAVAGSGGTVTAATPASSPTLSSVACNPTSLAGPSATACTVTLSSAAAAATTVSLTSNSTAVVVPQSVTVTAGSSTAQFSAVASSTMNTTVTLTATLNAISKTTTLALTTSTFSLRVNAGGAAYVDAQGFTWSADNGYNGGTAASTTNTVVKTNAVPLYQSVRRGMSGYQFTVPNGDYTVNLKFAEVSHSSVRQRIFSVTLNGNVILQNFDIIAAAGGPLAAVDKSFPVTVTDGTIQIGFRRQVDLPMVNAIEIVQQGAPLSQTAAPTPSTFTTQYINAGGPSIDTPSGVWGADRQFTGGNPFSTTHAITNTTTPALYQTCRYGEFYYPIAVPNGNYTVTLKFAEISQTGARQRVFNVQIDGTPVLTGFDIIAAVGAPYVAIDKTFPVTVSNGVLVIGFTPGEEDVPLVNAIEIVKN